MSVTIAGKRVLVVGASEGIGREFAERAVRDGARVLMCARRADALSLVVDSAGGGQVAIVDVTDDASIDALVATVIEAFGEVDLVLYAVGSASMRRLVEFDREMWDQTLSTNVVGFNQLTRRLIGSLSSGAIVVALSSESAAVPRDGLIAYAASKAALEASVRGWRAEHPEVRWSCVAVGATFPTAFGSTFDPDLIGPLLDVWIKKGLLQDAFMVPGEVAEHLLAIYTSALSLASVNVEHIVLRSPSATMGTSVG